MSKKGGGIIFECSEALRKLRAIDQLGSSAESATIKNIKRQFPKQVSAATAAIYQIGKEEVAAAARTKARLTAKQFNAQRMAHVRTSFTGSTLDSLTVTFTGKKHPNWSTTATPMPKQVSQRTFSSREPYTITQTVYRGKPVTISGQGNNRVFVMQRKGKLIPMIIGEERGSKPLVKAATSIPQAIANEQVVARWQQSLNKYIAKRYEKNIIRLANKI